ncbi:MAG: U32 family peptidase C-terminal domain-containing protein [Methylobacillus sp.]|nr:U32 family peptidase C-terminal domain-containing protein [Methylobacillus sp.]
MEIIHPNGNREMIVNALYNETGEPVNHAPGSGHRVRMALPGGDVGRALLARMI